MIDGIGVMIITGRRLGLVDSDGSVPGNLHYRDSWTDTVMVSGRIKVPKQKVFEQTGTQFM